MQSKRQSLIETVTSTFTGLVGSWCITFGVMTYLPGSVGARTTVAVALCTVWSLVRGYAVRRYFNQRA